MSTNGWPEVDQGRIATKNQKGFMFVNLEGASQAFLNYVEQCQGTIADIGCAYGVATIPALKRSQAEVIAFDLSKEHLAVVSSSVPAEMASRLTTICGSLPHDLNLTDNSLAAVHCSHVLHFLSGNEVQSALMKFYQSLQAGGKLFLNVASVYFSVLSGLLDVFEKNQSAGLAWPGEIDNVKQYVPESDKPHAPDFFHTFKLGQLANALECVGFIIEDIAYYDISEPTWFASDGRGMISVIATKR